MEQARITDFFQSSKRNAPLPGEQVKRKTLSPTTNDYTRPVLRLKRKRDEFSPEPQLDLSAAITNRGKLLLSLSRSPVKSPFKSPLGLPPTPEKSATVAGSPVKRKLVLESVKSPTKEPAYLKYRHLAKKDGENQLILPTKYKAYVKLFECLDSVVSLFLGRKKALTFEAIRGDVQRMSGRSFDLTKLAQIKTIYPESYILRYEKQPTLSFDAKLQYQLILEPVFDGKTMTPSVCTRRKDVMARKLMTIVKSHHRKFLQSLDPPITVNDDEIVRWHPSFLLEEVPDIEPRPNVIPPAPVKADVQTALYNIIKKPSEEKNEAAVEAVPSSPTKITSGALKGLSTGFLAKIRAKEANKMLKEMTRSPAVERKLSIIKRLPDVIRIINSYFISEHKTTILFANVATKVRDSYYTDVSANDIEDWINTLAELLPDWLYKLNVRKGVYVKIDQQKPIEGLVKRLEAAAERLKGSD